MISLFLGRDGGVASPLAGSAGAGLGGARPAGGGERETWLGVRQAWTEASWWDVDLRDDVRALLWLPAGPELVRALSELPQHRRCPFGHDADRFLHHPAPGSAEGWPCGCQVVEAAAWDACAAWLSTRSAAALVRAVGSDTVEVVVGGGRRTVVDPAREQLAVSLRCSPAAMANRIAAARALMAQPALVGLVGAGAISPWAGRLVTEQVTDLDDEQAAMVVAQVVTRVESRLLSGRRPYHSAEVNRLARQARLRVCPEAVQEARVRAFAGRRVTVIPQRDGMASLVAELAETDAHRMHRRLTAIATGVEADAAADAAAGVGLPEPRTRDQLRADVLVDLILGDAGTLPEPPGHAEAGTPVPGAPPVSGGPAGPAGGGSAGCCRCTDARRAARPEVSVVVSLAALLGVRDDPAEVLGVGPVPAAVARELAADGTWRAWITDSAGDAVTATGSAGYTPSPALARLVRAREPHCRFPGCRQPAARCDLDHAIPWPRGTTAPPNLGPLCRRHHNLKTHLGWQLSLAASTPRDRRPPPAGAAPARLPATSWKWHSPAGLATTDGPQPPLA